MFVSFLRSCCTVGHVAVNMAVLEVSLQFLNFLACNRTIKSSICCQHLVVYVLQVVEQLVTVDACLRLRCRWYMVWWYLLGLSGVLCCEGDSVAQQSCGVACWVTPHYLTPTVMSVVSLGLW